MAGAIDIPVRGDLPKASIVIATYNSAPYIRQAVESALNQTLADLEVIVVDDGSTDGTHDALMSLADPRMRVLVQQNAGPSASRNVGIQLARTPYVGFLDGDDLWLPEKLEKHIEFLASHPETDLTYSLAVTIDEAGKEIGEPAPKSPRSPSFRELLTENFTRTTSTVIVRKSVFQRTDPFDTALRVYHDHDLWLRIALLRPGNVACIGEILTLYRRRRGQITANWRLMQSEWPALMEKARRLAKEEVRQSEAEANSRMNRYFASLAYEAGDFVDASRLLLKGVRQAPARSLTYFQSWMLGAACVAGLILPAGLHRQLERIARSWSARRANMVRAGAGQ